MKEHQEIRNKQTNKPSMASKVKKNIVKQHSNSFCVSILCSNWIGLVWCTKYNSLLQRVTKQKTKAHSQKIILLPEITAQKKVSVLKAFITEQEKALQKCAGANTFSLKCGRLEELRFQLFLFFTAPTITTHLFIRTGFKY